LTYILFFDYYVNKSIYLFYGNRDSLITINIRNFILVTKQISYNNELLSSHQFANDIRELYNIPSIPPEEKLSLNIITNLIKFLNEYFDLKDIC